MNKVLRAAIRTMSRHQGDMTKDYEKSRKKEKMYPYYKGRSCNTMDRILLAGLSAPDAGRVLRRPGLRLGYLPQYRSIDRQFPVTVLEVVRSGLANQKSLFRRFSREADRQAMDTLSTLGLDHLATCPIDSLSGGQWQRTLLGRALVSRPELLLLDEPDTHLDVLHRQQLYDTLTQQRPNMAIVVVSHDEALPSIFPNSHRLMVENGCVQEL